MEHLLLSETTLAGICVILTLSALMRVFEFLWKMKEKNDLASEASVKDLTTAVYENTATLRHLDQRLAHMENVVAEVPKFKNDMRRFYAGLREVAGDRWPRVRDEILKDNLAP